MSKRRLVHPSQIESATSEPDAGAYTYAELKSRVAANARKIASEGHDDSGHDHIDSYGIVHRCYHKCRSWIKIAVLVLITDVICELVTFLPIHRLFEMLGWIH